VAVAKSNSNASILHSGHLSMASGVVKENGNADDIGKSYIEKRNDPPEQASTVGHFGSAIGLPKKVLSVQLALAEEKRQAS